MLSYALRPKKPQKQRKPQTRVSVIEGPQPFFSHTISNSNYNMRLYHQIWISNSHPIPWPHTCWACGVCANTILEQAYTHESWLKIPAVC